MDSDSKAPRLEEISTDATADDKTSAAFSVSTPSPFVADSGITMGPFTVDNDVEYRNKQFGNMDFRKVRVAGNDLEVIAEPEGEAQRRAILILCNEMGRTIDGFNPSKLSPFPINDTVVFLRSTPGDADNDVYEGTYTLETIDYLGCAYAG